MNTGILRLTKYTKDFCQQTEEHWQSNWKSEHSHPQNEKTNHIAESKQSTHCKESKPVNTIAEKKKWSLMCVPPPKKCLCFSTVIFPLAQITCPLNPTSYLGACSGLYELWSETDAIPLGLHQLSKPTEGSWNSRHRIPGMDHVVWVTNWGVMWGC